MPPKRFLLTKITDDVSQFTQVATKKSFIKREPKTYQVVLLEDSGNLFTDLLSEEKEDVKIKLPVDVFQSKFPLISSNLFEVLLENYFCSHGL